MKLLNRNRENKKKIMMRCTFSDCQNKPYYALTFRNPDRCRDHKENRVNQNTICMCGTTFPSFGNPDDKRASCCKKCKTAEMTNIKDKTCEGQSCKTQARFNLPGEKMGRFCAKHKDDDMIDVKGKKCEDPECIKQPFFNHEAEKTPRFCATHKLEGMIDIKNIRCEFNGCRSQPGYNFKDQSKARFCKKHMMDGMIDVHHKKCENINCMIRPTFNLKGSKIGRFCKIHKEDNMINVVDKLCEFDGCLAQPFFNHIGLKVGRFCTKHKLTDMVDVKNKQCEEKDCNTQPQYNFPDTNRGRFCATHKKDGMINIVLPSCQNNEADCRTLGNPKYRGYCSWCFQHLFPDDPITKQIRVKTKELAVRDYIDTHFEGFIHDKPLFTPHCDCTIRRRIDHYRIFDGTILAIETDEHQHRGYDPEEERLRYDDIYMGFSGKWIFIRFNPDAFIDEAGVRRDPPLNDRLPLLHSMIDRHIDRIEKHENDDLIEIHRLFYSSKKS